MVSAFDPANPRKDGCEVIPGKTGHTHPRTSSATTSPTRLAAYTLAQLPFPGVGACPERSRMDRFYQNDRPTKNALEKKWVDTTREKVGNATDLELLQKTFDRMK
jgi:2-oxoglutarate ferredoxin oxidoreductase subunit beta